LCFGLCLHTSSLLLGQAGFREGLDVLLVSVGWMSLVLGDWRWRDGLRQTGHRTRRQIEYEVTSGAQDGTRDVKELSALDMVLGMTWVAGVRVDTVNWITLFRQGRVEWIHDVVRTHMTSARRSETAFRALNQIGMSIPLVFLVAYAQLSHQLK